ncbi:2-succinylbenzoate-CoA ligase, partial [Halobacteriales archaeon QS_9_70_65]
MNGPAFMRDWLAVRADATPEATALAAAGDVDVAATYADLDRRVETLAGRLAARGVGVDHALAVCSGTRAAFVEVVHAAQRLGATLVPVDARA